MLSWTVLSNCKPYFAAGWHCDAWCGLSNILLLEDWRSSFFTLFPFIVVELIPLQIETISRLPSITVYVFHIFNQFPTWSYAPFQHEPDPSNTYSHRSDPPDLSDSTTTLQIRMSDYLIESCRSIKHFMTFIPIVVPSDHGQFMFYHVHVHFSFVNIYFITFIFILLFWLIATQDWDLHCQIPLSSLIVPSHPV